MSFESGEEQLNYPEDIEIIEYIDEHSTYVDDMDINDKPFGEIFEDSKYPTIFHTDHEIEGMEHYNFIMKYGGNYYYGKGNTGLMMYTNFCYGCYSCRSSTLLLDCAKCENCNRCIDCFKCYYASEEKNRSYYNPDDD